MWDLWYAKWHWDMISPRNSVFSPSVMPSTFHGHFYLHVAVTKRQTDEDCGSWTGERWIAGRFILFALEKFMQFKLQNVSSTVRHVAPHRLSVLAYISFSSGQCNQTVLRSFLRSVVPSFLPSFPAPISRNQSTCTEHYFVQNPYIECNPNHECLP
jgi:hypothetical protein